MELYLPTSEYDMDTISSVLYSLLNTAFVVAVAVFACFPEAKFSQEVTKRLKKIFPQVTEDSLIQQQLQAQLAEQQGQRKVRKNKGKPMSSEDVEDEDE